MFKKIPFEDVCPRGQVLPHLLLHDHSQGGPARLPFRQHLRLSPHVHGQGIRILLLYINNTAVKTYLKVCVLQ